MSPDVIRRLCGYGGDVVIDTVDDRTAWMIHFNMVRWNDGQWEARIHDSECHSFFAYNDKPWEALGRCILFVVQRYQDIRAAQIRKRLTELDTKCSRSFTIQPDYYEEGPSA